jgi:rare lipoprotein A
MVVAAPAGWDVVPHRPAGGHVRRCRVPGPRAGERAGCRHLAAGCQPASVRPAVGGNGAMLQPSDGFRLRPEGGGHVRQRRRPATTDRPGRHDRPDPGGGRPLRTRRPLTPRRTASRGPRRVTMRVAGLTAGAVLAAAAVAPDQAAAMITGDAGAAEAASSAGPQPSRFEGLPDKARLAAAQAKAARTPPKPPSRPRPRRARSRAPASPATSGAVAGGLHWTASWYGPGFAGHSTASGEVFDPFALTAAHKTLPFGTRLLVRNPDTGRSVWVRVNDRGPYAGGRDLDLSQGAAQAIGLAGTGEVIVRIA